MHQNGDGIGAVSTWHRSHWICLILDAVDGLDVHHPGNQNSTGFRLSNVFTSKWLPLLIVPFSQDRPHTSHHLLTLIIRPDLSVLPHSFCYMFLLPPRPSVAKPSGSQLLRFGTLFHKISGYYHPLALSNAVSKLTSFPTPASHVPHLAIRQRLWLELAWICALYKFCNNNIIILFVCVDKFDFVVGKYRMMYLMHTRNWK